MLTYANGCYFEQIYYLSITQNQEASPIILIAKDVNFYVKDGDLHFLKTSNEKE